MIACEWGYEGCIEVGTPVEMTTHNGDAICWPCKRTGDAEYADWLSCARSA